MKSTPKAAAPLPVESWPITRPKPYPKNARTVTARAVDSVAASLKEFGWRQPIVVDEKDVILAGHKRLLAAQKLGMTEVPVHVAVGLSKAQAKAYRLMDNRSNENSEWDMELLQAEMQELVGKLDTALTGFDETEIERFLKPDPQAEPDEVPETPEAAITVASDLWLLAKHRVLCGSTTDAQAVAKLTAGRKIAALMSDPPYGVRYSGGRGCVRKEFANDDLDPEKYGSFLEDGLKAWDPHIAPKAPLYMWFADRQGEAVYGAIRQAGWRKTAVIIWAKQHFIFSRAVHQYHQQHEPCVYATRHTGLADWVGPMNETTLWQVDRPMASGDHPTTKPVELYRRAIKNSVAEGDVVGEMFLGSGSCLIGADETGRICYGTELDPHYVDVIVQRWQKFTGQKATLDGDGRTFEEIQKARAKETKQSGRTKEKRARAA